MQTLWCSSLSMARMSTASSHISPISWRFLSQWKLPAYICTACRGGGGYYCGSLFTANEQIGSIFLRQISPRTVGVTRPQGSWERGLILVAMALFFHVISWPQVPLNLAAQVTRNLATKRRDLPPFAPTAVVMGPSTQALLTWYSKLKYCLSCLPSWQLVIQIYLLFW